MHIFCDVHFIIKFLLANPLCNSNYLLWPVSTDDHSRQPKKYNALQKEGQNSIEQRSAIVSAQQIQDVSYRRVTSTGKRRQQRQKSRTYKLKKECFHTRDAEAAQYQGDKRQRRDNILSLSPAIQTRFRNDGDVVFTKQKIGAFFQIKTKSGNCFVAPLSGKTHSHFPPAAQLLFVWRCNVQTHLYSGVKVHYNGDDLGHVTGP